MDTILARALRFTRSCGIWFCVALLCAIVAPPAHAGFIGSFAAGNFTFSDLGGVFPDGSAVFPDTNTLILTGSNDGSGLDSSTQLTLTVPVTGLFRFDYVFLNMVPAFGTDPLPHGGYLLAPSLAQLSDPGSFVELSDAFGGSGSVLVPLTAGEVFGFAVIGDNTGGPGVLTVTNFTATPEPGTAQLLFVAVAVAALAIWRRRGLVHPR